MSVGHLHFAEPAPVDGERVELVRDRLRRLAQVPPPRPLRALPLWRERDRWGIAEHRAAAGVLGDLVRQLLEQSYDLRATLPAQGLRADGLEIAAETAVREAHYYWRRARQLEDAALGTMGGVSR